MNIEGDTYPPPRVNEILSNVMFAVRISLMLLILAGPDALRSIGIENPPGIYMWTQDNKVQFDLRVLVRIIILICCVDVCSLLRYCWYFSLGDRLKISYYPQVLLRFM